MKHCGWLDVDGTKCAELFQYYYIFIYLLYIHLNHLYILDKLLLYTMWICGQQVAHDNHSVKHVSISE